MEKICIHCNQEKSINDFGMYKKRSGEIGYRNVCKQCKLEQDRRGSVTGTRTSEYTPRVRTETNIEYKIERNLYNMLSSEEIEKIKLLVLNADGILKLLENKIDLNESYKDSRRVKKSITIDEHILNRLNSYCIKNNINLSELINIVLKKGLEYLD